MAVEAAGIPVILGWELRGGVLRGSRARGDAWIPAEGRPRVLHDRFPGQRQAEAHAAIYAQVGALPVGNPKALIEVCRDKLALQRLAEAGGMHMPELEADPDRFQAALQRWGVGFLKPRYGAQGMGVRRVRPGDELPALGEGSVPGRLDPMLLQRAVHPPRGWAGACLRMLCQRSPPSEGGDGGFIVVARLLRRSLRDPVVNTFRGAEVVAAEDHLPGPTLAEAEALTARICQLLGAQPQGEWLVELGVDLVIDEALRPHLLEVNSRPAGRLQNQAQADPARYAAAHLAACARPMRYLAWRAGLAP